LEAIAVEKESLEQELHAREAELLSKLEIAQDAAEAHMTAHLVEIMTTLQQIVI
jgi:hypothetical protein